MSCQSLLRPLLPILYLLSIPPIKWIFISIYGSLVTKADGIIWVRAMMGNLRPTLILRLEYLPSCCLPHEGKPVGVHMFSLIGTNSCFGWAIQTRKWAWGGGICFTYLSLIQTVPSCTVTS